MADLDQLFAVQFCMGIGIFIIYVVVVCIDEDFQTKNKILGGVLFFSFFGGCSTLLYEDKKLGIEQRSNELQSILDKDDEFIIIDDGWCQGTKTKNRLTFMRNQKFFIGEKWSLRVNDRFARLELDKLISDQ